MPKRTPARPGRPKKTYSSDPIVALAFGSAVRARRAQQGIAQEALAHLAQVERSHMGKIERGQHMPTLTLILKLAKALGVRSSDLMVDTEAQLPTQYFSDN